MSTINPSRREALGDFTTLSALLLAPTVPLPAATIRTPAWDFGRSLPIWGPFDLVMDGTLLAIARLNGRSVRAVLDSGSGASIIDGGSAAAMDLDHGEARTISGLSGKARVKLARNVDVELGGETRRLPFAVIGDLGAMSAALGRRIDLLIGADLFADRCVAIDFERRRFGIAPSGSFVGGSRWVTKALTRGSKQELLMAASVAGSPPLPLMIDLGSAAPLMLSEVYIRANGLTDHRPTSTALLGGVDGTHPITLFTLDRLRLGDLNIARIPTVGMDRWTPAEAVGNVGLPLIAQFDVVFDISRRQIWLRTLPSAKRMPLMKDRSGLGIAITHRELRVVHVATDSPAAEGQWKTGDRIVRIDGRDVEPSYTHGSLWRWRYDRPGKVVQLTIASGEKRSMRLRDYY